MSGTNGLRWWQYIDWPGAIAFVLSLGISVSMVMIVAGAIILGQMSEHGANMLSTMYGAAIGALATYLGQSTERRQQAANKPPEGKTNA